MTRPSGGSPHYGEMLQDYLDGTLTDARRAQVAAHLKTCVRCRRELDALRWVKTQASSHVGNVPVPPGLSERVRGALDAEDRGGAATISRRAWIAGIGLAAAALLVILLRGRRPTMPGLVAGAFLAYDTGALPLEFESSEPAAIEAYFRRQGVTFQTRVFDLAMMNYQLAGGRVHRLGDDGRTSALFAYRGPRDTRLVCQMYQGTIDELPQTDDVREHNGFRFYVYRVEDVAVVFWAEGDVLCVLASNAPTEDVVQLAFAKAMRVQG